jgi:hypothetical protein
MKASRLPMPGASGISAREQDTADGKHFDGVDAIKQPTHGENTVPPKSVVVVRLAAIFLAM